MNTLLLFVPSAMAVTALMWHAWHYRGRRIALSFFFAAFLFGVARGNAIHYITVKAQGGVMPYVFTQPVVQIFSASLQAIIGWIFSLYVSWWLAERVLARIPSLKGDLMGTVGMTCVGMAAVGYGVEGGAAAAGWWQWSIPTYNRFFVDVPTVGIAEWFAVGFEFFIPYLLAFCTPYPRRVWPHALWSVSFFHLFLHLFSEPISQVVPTQPFVLWHWVSILSLGGLALTGVCSTTLDTTKGQSKSRHGLMWAIIGLFAAVMVIAQVGIGGRPELLVSLIPLGLLCLMALVSTPWILVSAAVAWAFAGGVVSASVAAFLFLKARAQWGRQRLFRVCIVALFVGIGLGVYRSGVALSQQCEVYMLHLERAARYAGMGRMDMAAREQAAADALDPEDVEAYLQIGYALQRRGFLGLAIAQFRKAIDLEATLFTAHFDLGIALERFRDMAGAEAAFRRSIALAPRFYEGHVRLGKLLLNQNRADSAQVYFERAIQAKKNRPDAYNQLGMAQRRLGDVDAAIEAWHKALERDPEFADAYSNIGDAYVETGRSEEAVQVYEAALKIDPTHPRAQRGMQMIRNSKTKERDEADE